MAQRHTGRLLLTIGEKPGTQIRPVGGDPLGVGCAERSRPQAERSLALRPATHGQRGQERLQEVRGSAERRRRLVMVCRRTEQHLHHRTHRSGRGSSAGAACEIRLEREHGPEGYQFH